MPGKASDPRVALLDHGEVRVRADELDGLRGIGRLRGSVGAVDPARLRELDGDDVRAPDVLLDVEEAVEQLDGLPRPVQLELDPRLEPGTGVAPGLDVIEASESRIGGLVGSQITVENAGETHATVLEVPPGLLGIDPGRRLWIAFFDTDAGLLAIMVGGSTERWDEALSAAEPVLESVRIGP